MAQQTTFTLTPEIKKAIREIRHNLRAIETATSWVFEVECNKVFARMCSDEILSQALTLHNAFKEAGIGYRDGQPLTLRMPLSLMRT